MNVIIRKAETGEVFDLPDNFSIEVNNTSPIFNQVGSKTVAASLPRNPHNARLLGYAHRTDIVRKPTGKARVIVSEGSYVRTGILYLNAASNTEKTYSVTIAFNEGIMYEEMKQIKLTALPNLPVIEKDSFDEMETYMNSLFHGDDLSEPLTAFHVVLKNQGTYEVDDVPTRNYPNLNEPDDNGNLKINRKVKHLEGNEPILIDVPVGYGITSFVRLWKVLELIFSHFGYTLRDNPFRSEFQLRRLVLLNNTIDTIVNNRIDYAQLMPEVTIFELLTALFVRFGAKVFVEGNTRTVDIMLLRDILSGSADMKLQPADLIDIEYSEPKQLKLSAGKSLDMSDTETDTFEEFLAKYNNTMSLDNDLFYKTGIGWYRLHGRIYQKPVGDVTDPWEKKYGRFVSSIHFDWNRRTPDIKEEEYSSVDEALTMMYDDGSQLYYGIDFSMRNSRLEVNNDIRDVDVPNKLAFAFDFGEGHLDLPCKFGSILPYAPDGYSTPYYIRDKEGNEMKYALTFVGKEGCFNQFHRQHDAMLRHSCHILKTKVDVPVFQLANMDYKRLYNLSGQPVLIDKLNYILGDFNNKEVIARTTRLYEPYDLDSEQNIPPFLPVRYKWVLSDNWSIAWLSLQDLRYQYWRHADSFPGMPNPHTYEFIDCYIKPGSGFDPNPPTDINVWYLPPTEQQMNRGTAIAVTPHTVPVEIIVKFSYLPRWPGERVTVERTDPEATHLTYKSFYIPDLIVSV